VLPYAASTDEARCKLQADLFYIKHMSLMTDLRIMLKTVRVVLLGRERRTRAGAAEEHRTRAEVPSVAERPGNELHEPNRRRRGNDSSEQESSAEVRDRIGIDDHWRIGGQPAG
jgi:hypothetical protein